MIGEVTEKRLLAFQSREVTVECVNPVFVW
jgi:hypothetical protein